MINVLLAGFWLNVIILNVIASISFVFLLLLSASQQGRQLRVHPAMCGSRVEFAPLQIQIDQSSLGTSSHTAMTI